MLRIIRREERADEDGFGEGVGYRTMLVEIFELAFTNANPSQNTTAGDVGSKT